MIHHSFWILALVAPAAAQSAGPDCAGATPISQPLVGKGFNIGSFNLAGEALDGPVPPCHTGGGADQWFAWTSTFGTSYTFSVFTFPGVATVAVP